jgi:hypothetical protein
MACEVNVDQTSRTCRIDSDAKRVSRLGIPVGRVLPRAFGIQKVADTVAQDRSSNTNFNREWSIFWISRLHVMIVFNSVSF